MCDTRRRLIALLSLGAFLIANTHAGAALVAYLSEAAPTVQTEQTSPQNQTNRPVRSRCSCCARRTAEAAPLVPTAPCKERTPGVSSGSESADSPKEHHGPKCPCPGGCAACNLGKIPCLIGCSQIALPAICLGARPAEPPAPYAPPHTGRLLRPPRV